MSSKAVRLRQRAESNPRDLVNETDKIKNCLTATRYDERRHATSAARKVAYVAPGAVTGCIDELSEIANSGRSTSIRKNACRALGHIGRVDDRAVQTLAEQQRTATNDVRSTAATARNSLARASLPRSVDSNADTEVYDQSSEFETDICESDDGSDTDIYEFPSLKIIGDGSDTDLCETTPISASEGAGEESESPNFCSHCGTDLRETTDPNFCSNCGTRL